MQLLDPVTMILFAIQHVRPCRVSSRATKIIDILHYEEELLLNCIQYAARTLRSLDVSLREGSHLMHNMQLIREQAESHNRSNIRPNQKITFTPIASHVVSRGKWRVARRLGSSTLDPTSFCAVL